MNIMKKYRILHAAGVKLIAFEAHFCMAFMFSTFAAALSHVNITFWLVIPSMMAVIAGKEYMDSRSALKLYSWSDLSQWAGGAALSVALEMLRS